MKYLFFPIIVIISFIILSIKPTNESSESKYLRHKLDSISNNINILYQQVESYKSNDSDLYKLLKIDLTDEILPNDSICNIQDSNIKIYIYNLECILDSLKKEYNRILKEKENFKKIAYHKIDSLNHMPNIKPVSNTNVIAITNQFGYRLNKNKFYQSGHLKFETKIIKHDGIDLSLVENSPIYSTADGVVEMARKDKSGYGLRIVIDHGYGFKTVYAHLNKIKVLEGMKVKKGQIIAKSGNTGNSMGPHLHYEIHRKNVPIDPINFMYLDNFIMLKN